MIAIKDVPQLFPTCEPLLYSHLLPRRLVAADKVQGRDEPNTTETPTTLLAAIVGLKPEQISESSVITRFGLDSLGGVYILEKLISSFNSFYPRSQLCVSVMSSRRT
jgi:hypothetical protein